MSVENASAVSSEKEVEDLVYSCLDLDSPKSFFLYAGAGSGKTRTLVEVMKRFREQRAQRLRLAGQRVAIITYTNAACDEIKRRLEYDSTFLVSTIHSFAWELIKGFQDDIREWVKQQLTTDIAELEEAQRKGRAGSKASQDRPRQIESKQKKLAGINSVRKFIYNPNGDNISKNSLNHADVLKMTYEFLQGHELLQRILVREFPILLIDESQDTKRELMDAFFSVQEKFAAVFTLGLFGDTMQRIYADGKVDLEEAIPDTWAKPAKVINYRSKSRIVTLINSIRKDVDSHSQSPWRQDGPGQVRLFIKDTRTEANKREFEASVRSKMAEVSEDECWTGGDVKTLTLEHHMAAIRGGFATFFAPLYSVERFRTGLLDGTMAGVSLFINQVVPTVKATKSLDDFAVARLVRGYSPLLGKDAFAGSKAPVLEIAKAEQAVSSLAALFSDEQDPPLIDVLTEIHRSGLFQIPDSLLPIVSRSSAAVAPDSDENEVDRDAEIDAWDEALKSTFREFQAYATYISEQSQFGTHQGIKGLEFPRVVVILDDEEARGFLFSYEKSFGAKAESSTDRSNETSGKETSTERTRRLFYVTCSRAEQSLAVIAYTKAPQELKRHVLSKGWFSEEEIVEDGVGGA
jgi:DNA helicase-2/ATP-dependent DNA helicase PcrA